MSEIQKKCDLKSASVFYLCNGFDLFHRVNKRVAIFMLLICLQITITGVYLMYSDFSIINNFRVNLGKKRNNFNVTDSFSLNKSWTLRLRSTETLGKFYFKPEAGTKKLYMWENGGMIPVNVSSVPLTKLARHLIKSENCSITKQNITSKTYLKAQDCKKIHNEMKDLSYFSFQEEIDIEIAYSILVYTDYDMLEILLRTIYKPQNIYCIHIDNKSSTDFKNRVRGLAACFENVFIASKLVKVYWGKFSVLEAEMSCMTDLLNKTKSWKYFINLTGQEFPLRTNYEIAKVLSALQGFNNLKCNKLVKQSDLIISGRPPYGLTTYKTSTHVVLTREFIEYFLYNKTARAVLNWTRKLKIPSDEIAFSTIICNKKLKAPGSYTGQKSEVNHNLNYVARFKIWIGKTPHICHGKRLRGLCSFGPKDLETLEKRHELFANKFNIRVFPEVAYCLRNTLLERSYLEYSSYLDYNVTFNENITHK